MEVGITDGQTQLKRQSKAETRLRSTALDFGLHAGVAICVFGGLLLLYGLRYPIHHDLAGGVLSGRLAVALGDSFSNYSIYFPPAEKFWFSLAARLSDLTALRLDLTVVVMTAAMVLFGAGLAYRIRREAVGASPLFLVWSVALLVILPILFKNIFGLREPIVAAGLWPYLVLRVSDPDGTRIGRETRFVLGVWMGATLLFKYLYSIVVLLVEVTDALIQRRPALLFRIENIVAGGVVGLYLFFWLGIDPSQRAAIGVMFSGIDAALADPATNWVKMGQNFGYATAFLVVLRGFRVPGRLMALGFAAVIGAVLVCWAQERWYTHHMFPIVLAYAAWWWMAKSYLRWWAHVAFGLALSYASFGHFARTFEYQRQVAEVDQAIREAGRSVNGKRVGILTMHPSPYNQYLASHGAVRWNAQVNNAYVATELKPFDTKENAGIAPPPAKFDDPGRRIIHDQMLRLWEDMPPEVLIVDHKRRWPLRYVKVEWEQVFSRDPRFSAILKHYRPVLTHEGKRISFTYYVRTD